MTHITNLGLAAVMALVMAASWHLDGPDDHQADWADSQAIIDLQTAQAGSARQQKAAQALCNQARGPNSEARWTLEGHLVCSSKRGYVISKVSP